MLAALLCAALLLPCAALADGLAIVPDSVVTHPLRIVPLADGTLWISGHALPTDGGTGTVGAAMITTPGGDVRWSMTHRYADTQYNMLRDVVPLPDGGFVALYIVMDGDDNMGVLTRVRDGVATDDNVYHHDFGTALLPVGDGRYAVSGIHEHRRDRHGGTFYPANLALHAADGTPLWRQTYDMELNWAGVLPVADGLLGYGVLEEQETGKRNMQLGLALLDDTGALTALSTGASYTTMSFGGEAVRLGDTYTLAALTTGPPDYAFDCHILRFDAQGNLLGDIPLPQSVVQVPYALCATPAGLVLLGKVQGEAGVVRVARLDAYGAAAHSWAVRVPDSVAIETAVGLPTADGLTVLVVGTTVYGNNPRALALYSETFAIE